MIGRVCATFLMWAAFAIVLPAQTTAVVALPAQTTAVVTFTTLHSFDGTDGEAPHAVLVQGTDGNFYGTTYYAGGSNNCIGGCGTVFSITPDGTLTTLHSFNGTDGGNPVAGLVQGTDGKFYGTTTQGGANTCPEGFGCGTVFSITSAGILTTLHSFEGADGDTPSGGLVQGINGRFYGTTSGGGPHADGTVFSVTTGGVLTTLHNFDGTDGNGPEAALIEGKNGKLYGTTSAGGANLNSGTVFSITKSGTLTTLYSFCSATNCTDGAYPTAPLVQGTGGKFYGTTFYGGANNKGTIFCITAEGTPTTLHTFDGADGANPGALVRGTDGAFYGTAGGGDNEGNGTVFSITAGGILTTLHSFNGTDGDLPNGPIQGTDGMFYGTTQGGGGNLEGTVFGLSVGLGPFVETNPVASKVEATVTILGTDLTGATKVTFHGIAATFTVVSSSEITTTVPAGATTGTVKVVTPGGTLSSNVPFQVLP